MPRLVWVAACLAALGRFPSVMWPLRPDEAGFLLVAQTWDPGPESVYGHYFVDRHPLIIAVVRLADWVGGPYFLRLVGALGCSLLVLAVAAAAREITRHAGLTGPDAARRVEGWTAVVTAALVVNAEIDAISTKGELLGIPLVAVACWLSLRATRLRSSATVFVGGLVAVTAMGMKQNLVGGLAFGGVVLIGSLLAGHLTGRAFARLALAASAGALVPVVATITWALWAGVRLETLSYTVIGFRSDAAAVIARQENEGATERMGILLIVFIATGMALAAAWFLARLPGLLRRLPVPAAAVLVMLVVDGAGVILSGSYWLPYLLVLVPALGLATACALSGDLLEERPAVPRLSKVVVGFVALTSVMSLVGFVGWWESGRTAVEVETGRAIADAARPGDTLTVFGGRADIQWASGLPSPYSHLWSLPMRTLDLGYDDLRDLLTGTTPPTWVVEVVRPDTWTELGVRPIEQNLLRKYELVTTACDQHRIYHLNTVEDLDLDIECGRDFRFIW